MKYYKGKPVNLSASSTYMGAPGYQPKHKEIKIGIRKSPPSQVDQMQKHLNTLGKQKEYGGKGWGP